MVPRRTRALVFVLLTAALSCGQSDSAGNAGGAGGAPGGSGGKGGSHASGGDSGAGAGGSAGSAGDGSSGANPGTGGGGGSSADAVSTGPGDAPVGDTQDAPTTDAPPATGPGKIVLVAGGGNGGDGSPAIAARVPEPFGTAIDPMNGDIYVVEYGGRVRRIDDKGIISTVVGSGAPGPGGQINLRQPHDLRFQPGTRNLFIADTMANRVLRLDATTGQVAVFAGAGTQVASGIGRAYCLAFDQRGESLYVTNNGGGRIEIIDLTTMAVTGVASPGPRAITVDSRKNLYVIAAGASSLRRFDPMGRASSVVGTLAAPKALGIDLEDNVLIADTENHSLLKLEVATSKLVRLAGNGSGGTGRLGGPPEMAQLARPHGVIADGQGRIYIADSSNHRVLRIER